MRIKGTVRVDKRTKDLIKRLNPGEIAVIDHKDIDEIAAQGLISSRVRAVVNAGPSISGKYPNPGPLAIVKAGIVLIDAVGNHVMECIQEGQEIVLEKGSIYVEGRLVAAGNVLDVNQIKILMEKSEENFTQEVEKFIHNTMEYAKKEIDIIIKGIEVPELRTRFKNRHALVVVRGHGYKKDLQTIKSYIKDVQPILIGVDGGADALLDAGYLPHLIVGDMDSVSDRALRCGAELVVHAYPDGGAPGMARLNELGAICKVVKAPGTSEDVAMLMAYQEGAQLIAAVGAHSSVVDFLEKGRPGMASTFLVRTKIGSILVDAKGVNKLYRSSLRFWHVAGIVAAALIPFAVIFIVSPTTHQLARLIVLQIKLMLSI